MARCVGVSRSTWSRVGSGFSTLSLDSLAKAAGSLDMTMGELILEADEIVRLLRQQDVEVHDSGDQVRGRVSRRRCARGHHRGDACRLGFRLGTEKQHSNLLREVGARLDLSIRSCCIPRPTRNHWLALGAESTVIEKHWSVKW